jgi:predicted cupin superfamily sugar epimerase
LEWGITTPGFCGGRYSFAVDVHPNKLAAKWIRELKLEPHPEGGYFRQTYRSDVMIARAALPQAFGGARAASTAIYFLLEGKNFSAFHRLRSDELWHFYAGSPLAVQVIDREGKCSTILLGNDPDAGQVFQAVVRAGCWFASHVADWRSWALVGCTVAPGFDFADFEMGKRGDLVQEYPQHREMIGRLTRE